MKRTVPSLFGPVFLGALLAGCGGTHGLRDNLPNLSSHSDKNVASYSECVSGKWKALTPEVSVTNKENASHISATDKNGARELLDITAEGTGARATMYESQNSKKDYDSRYRDKANACL